MFSLARQYYSHEKLIGKKRESLHEFCFQKGENWSHLPTAKKRGVSVYKRELLVTTGQKPTYRTRLYIDYETPTFSAENTFIETLMKNKKIPYLDLEG